MSCAMYLFTFKFPSRFKPRKSPKKKCLPAANVFTKNGFHLESELESNKLSDF